MILSLLVSMIIIETLIIFRINSKLEIYNPICILAIIPYFYINAFFFDYLIFGIDKLVIVVMDFELLLISQDYLKTKLLYLSYFIGLFIFFELRKNSLKSLSIQNLNISNHQIENKLNLKIGVSSYLGIAVIFSILLIGNYWLFEIYQLERSEIKNFFTNPILSIGITALFIYLCAILTLKKKISLIDLLIFFSLLSFSIIVKEREFVVILFFSLILKRKINKLSISVIIFSILMFLLVLYYKTLSVYILSLINSVDISFVDLIYNVSINGNISLAGSDPASPLAVLVEYLRGDHFLYTAYNYSYVTNTIAQFLRTFGLMEWNSLSELTKYHYTDDQMGTAFSMILESILNFWYFGPFIIAIILGTIAKYLLSRFSNRFDILYAPVCLFYFIFILKLVRTELAVVLKIYVIPIIIAYFLIKYFHLKK